MVDRIRDLCAKNKTTIAQLEREVGLGNGTITRWDRNSPSVANLTLVAQYFGVTVDSLIRR